MSYRIEFIDVGRRNKRWTSTLEQLPTEAVLERLVRKHGGLASRDVECCTDGNAGLVIVGGCRPVGRYEIHRTDDLVNQENSNGSR